MVMTNVLFGPSTMVVFFSLRCSGSLQTNLPPLTVDHDLKIGDIFVAKIISRDAVSCSKVNV